MLGLGQRLREDLILGCQLRVLWRLVAMSHRQVHHLFILTALRGSTALDFLLRKCLCYLAYFAEEIIDIRICIRGPGFARIPLVYDYLLLPLPLLFLCLFCSSQHLLPQELTLSVKPVWSIHESVRLLIGVRIFFESVLKVKYLCLILLVRSFR